MNEITFNNSPLKRLKVILYAFGFVISVNWLMKDYAGFLAWFGIYFFVWVFWLG